MAHQKSGIRRPVIGRWSYNVSYLLAHHLVDGGGAWVSCSPCGRWEPVDLPKLILDKNPLYSLWNRTALCRQCGRRMTYHAHHASGAPVIILKTDERHYTDDLHAAWDRERRRLAGLPDK